MKDDNELLIGYRPELQYEDDYVSDIDFNTFNNQDNNNNNNEDDSGKEEIDNLIQDMNDLNNLIDKLPNDVSGIVDEVFDPVIDFIEEELLDKELLPVPNKEEWIYEEYIPPHKDENPDNNDDNIPPILDDDALWDDEDFFPIKKEEHTEEEIIEKEYIKNLVDLFTDYRVNLHTTISNFWMNFIIASHDKSSSEIQMLLNNILLSSSHIKADAKHLLDTAVRQQLIKSMKFDYYLMMFNAEETIKQLQQLKAMKELRLRYSKIPVLDGSTKTNQSNNNLLTASKMTYDIKYEKAYENLYRYLSSSNKMLNDALHTWIQEIKSKQILIERKGINDENATSRR